MFIQSEKDFHFYILHTLMIPNNNHKKLFLIVMNFATERLLYPPLPLST